MGRAVLEGCRALGLEAVGADRGGPDHRRFDFGDRGTWAGAVEGCTQLFLLRPPPISDVAHTLNPFVDFARQRGVQHVVFLSVQGAESQPRIPHHGVEVHLRSTGRDWTFLRPGFFAQNFADAYRRDLKEDRRLYVPAGEGAVAFVDVRDLGLVAARIFAEPGAHRAAGYRLTGPRTFTFREAAALLSRYAGVAISWEPASIPGYLWHLIVRRRLPVMQAVVQATLHAGLRRGDAAVVDPLLGQLLGHPARDLEDFFKDEAPRLVA